MALGSGSPVRRTLAGWSGLLAILGALGLAGGVLLTLWVPDLRVYAVPTIVVSIVAIALAGVGSAFHVAEVIRGRRTQLSGITLATAAAAIAGFAALNLVAASTGVEWDLTATRQFELAPQTESVLASLKGPVEVTGFVVSSDDSDLRFEATAESYLSRFRQRTDLVSYRFVDPQREPSVARDFGVTRFPVLVVSSRSTGLRTALGPEPVTEQRLLTALLSVTGTQQHKIYFVTGHGERDANDLRTEGDGMGRAVAGLRDDGYQVATVDLSDGPVPDDASLVVIAAPRQPYDQAERARLVEWMREGGRTVMLVEPNAQEQPLADLLATWGLEAIAGTVADPERSAPGDSRTLIVQRDQYRGQTSVTEGQAIVQPLGPTLFPGAAAFRPLPDAHTRIARGDELPVHFEPLAVTSNEAWVSTSTADEPIVDEARGVQTVHLLVEASGMINETPSSSSEATTRLAVLGDVDFASNRYIDELGNRDFFLNTVSWLLEDDALVSVRPKQDVFRPLVLTAGEFDLVRYVSWFLLPAAIAGSGAIIWWRRR